MRIKYEDFKMLIVKYFIFFIFVMYVQADAANIQIKVEGLDGTLKFMVNEKLASIKNTDIYVDQRYQDKIRNIVYFCLRSLGYYSPDIRFFLYRCRLYVHEKENYVLVVQINPGIPIKVSKVNIVLNGDICHDTDCKKLLLEAESLVGKVLHHRDYDNFKSKLLSLSLSKGYLDAKFCKSQLFVFPYSYQSFWDIHFDSGQRYFFGKTTFYGGYIRERYLRNILKMDSRVYFDNKVLIEFNRRLFITNWFSSVMVSPCSIGTIDIKSIPIDVFLIPAISNNFEVGIGYSSDVIGRCRMVWKKPCVNVYGHSFENIFDLSILEQFIDLNYKIPLVRSPLQEYYLFQGEIKHENSYDKQSNFMVTINIARYWDSITGWKKGINFHWYIGYCDQFEDAKLLILIYPGITINRIHQRGGMMPYWGDSQYYSFNISNKLWGSDVNFFLVQAQNIWIRTLLYKHRVIIRDNIGWIKTNNLQYVFPFVRRFFFVSDFLIRGYKYQALFLKNVLSDSLIIPSKLVITSLEYQYNFFKKWWSVLFIDSGRITRNIDKNCYFKFGAGIGIRWDSPVGPAKLDFSIPLFCVKSDGFKLFHIYVGLGPEL